VEKGRKAREVGRTLGKGKGEEKRKLSRERGGKEKRGHYKVEKTKRPHFLFRVNEKGKGAKMDSDFAKGHRKRTVPELIALYEEGKEKFTEGEKKKRKKKDVGAECPL